MAFAAPGKLRNYIMKDYSFARVKQFLRGLLLLLTFGTLAAPGARAGLTFTLDLYRNNQGGTYVFYTPLSTNSILPAAKPGDYIISSPGWPTNGSVREFQLTSAGITDVFSGDGEYGYSDFDSAMQQITNGTWTILFTSATATNLYKFTVSAPTMTSNMLPATIMILPSDNSLILTNQTNFAWQGPVNWPVIGSAQVFGDSYYQSTNLPAAQTNWNVDSFIPIGSNY